MLTANARASLSRELMGGRQPRYDASVRTTSFFFSASSAASSAAFFFCRFLAVCRAASLCAALLRARFNSARVFGAFGGFGGSGTGGGCVGSGGASGSGGSRPAM